MVAGAFSACTVTLCPALRRASPYSSAMTFGTMDVEDTMLTLTGAVADGVGVGCAPVHALKDSTTAQLTTVPRQILARLE
ncbi:hypothetical protein GCM10027027_12060 [Neomicrococcus lactis]